MPKTSEEIHSIVEERCQLQDGFLIDKTSYIKESQKIKKMRWYSPEELSEEKKKLVVDVFGRIRNILFDKHYHKQIYVRFKISGVDLEDLERFFKK